ncbi:MAG: 50S ribosomal protein L4 [bacterium]
MPTIVNIYNMKAEKVDEVELNPDIFEVKPKEELINQALVAQMANSRNPIAHTKGRSEVRGGGKKPWKQKGTGRARHGSIRSPLWIGGGITFGPTNERNFELKINKKAKRKALDMVLSDKVANDKFIIIDKLAIKECKTKEMINFVYAFRDKFNNSGKSFKALITYTDKAENLIKAGRNIKKLKIIGVNSLNIKDLLGYEYIIMPKQGLAVIEELYNPRKLKKKICQF